MSKQNDKFTELVEKRNQASIQLEQANAALVNFLNQAGPTQIVPAVTPVGKKRGRKPGAKAVAASPATTTTTDAAQKQPSLKAIVQNILAKSSGMSLREIVDVVTEMINKNEYKSKAKKITPVVQQALVSLREDKLIAIKKSPDNNRNVYSLAA